MPLVSIKDYLKDAQKRSYAIPLLEAFEASMVEDMIAALEKKQAPGIIGVYAGFMEKRNTAALLLAARGLAAKASVPISIMLDHGRSVEECRKALTMGFTDIMYDGSALPVEENIANTKLVVAFGHDAGVGVEAELGKVGGGQEYQSFGGVGKGFTDPATVEKFYNETGVDFLAIAFGNAHGNYAGTPRLALDLLTDVRKRVALPLVMHGGSGLSEEQFRDSVKAGIAKINIATDLLNRVTESMKATATGAKGGFFEIFKSFHETLFDRCCYYLDLFGTSGKAQ